MGNESPTCAAQMGLFVLPGQRHRSRSCRSLEGIGARYRSYGPFSLPIRRLTTGGRPMPVSWYRRLFSRSPADSKKPHPVKRTPRFRPLLELLEERLALDVSYVHVANIQGVEGNGMVRMNGDYYYWQFFPL